MTKPTYTILDANGFLRAEGYSAAEAAISVLTYDGHQFEIRPADDGKGWRLWTTRFSRNSTCYDGLHRGVIFSIEPDFVAAEADIFGQVIQNAEWWRGQEVMTDADYAAMRAEMEADV